MYGGTSAPAGWMFCNGQLLNVADNPALFAVLGTKFGGDGVTTFGLPDMQGRVPVGAGAGVGLGTYILGQSGGSETVTLLTSEMPSHIHVLSADETGSGKPTPGTNVLGAVAPTAAVRPYSSNPPNTPMNDLSISSAGGDEPHPNIQPFQCVNFIIAVCAL